MHAEVNDFFCECRAQWPEFFGPVRVVEIGAGNVNGTIREFFSGAVGYLGVDWQAGPGVDLVSLGHAIPRELDGRFDVAVSTETLEHDPYWRETLRRMVDLIRPGGAIFLTCAGPMRPEHEKWTSPLAGYYGGLSRAAIVGALLERRAFDHISEDGLLSGWRVRAGLDVRVAAVGKKDAA